MRRDAAGQEVLRGAPGSVESLVRANADEPVQALPDVLQEAEARQVDDGTVEPQVDLRDLVDVALFGYEIPPTGVPDPPAAGLAWADDSLRDQGIARVLYTTDPTDALSYRHCSFIGSEDFIQRYPEHTKRVVKTLVLAAKWLSDQDANPAPVFQLWTRSGVTFANFKEDQGSSSLKVLSSPLVDEYLISQYKKNIEEAKRFGLMRISPIVITQSASS